MNCLLRFAAFGVLLLGLGSAAGCGNKGELYLPEPGQEPASTDSSDEDEDEQR